MARQGVWSKRLVRAFGKQSVIKTIEDLHELKRVLDADAEHFDANHQEGTR